MAEDHTIRSIDQLEVMEGSGGATWYLARKGLGEEAFGFNVVEIAPGGQIPEHAHTDDGQHEVFLILEGEGTLVADGVEHPAPKGTFARYSPAASRTIRNHSDAPVRALLIGVPADSGYTPMEWG